MDTESNIDELAFQFSAANEDPHPVILLGAGASFSSGVPLADQMTVEMAKWAYARSERSSTPDKLSIRRTQWERFLQNQNWYSDDCSLADLYPQAVEHLLVPQEFRRRVLSSIIKGHRKPSAGYQALADMCQRHLVGHFMTTNFDTLLEDALSDRRPHIREVTTVNKTPGDFEAFSPHRKAQVVYLHGTIENYTDRNLESETLDLEQALVERIHSLVEYSPIVVVGYRGAERSIMNGLFEAALKQSGAFRRGVFWCVRGNEPPHPNVTALGERIGSNLRLVRIQGFDELFGELNQRLQSDSLNPKGRRSPESAIAPQAFDSQSCSGIEISDLDDVALRATLNEHQRRLRKSDIGDLHDFLVEYEFADRIEGTLIPRNGLWLLFGEDVTTRMPHLKTVIRIGEKKQVVLEGNLLEQFNRAKELLAGEDFNPELRIKTSDGSETMQAFPPRALIELLVNHFVHRDYFANEPSEIHYQPGKSVTFKTRGALPDQVLHALSPGENGIFRPKRNIKAHRNPLLADVFYGIGVMDGEGSGLVDVESLAIIHRGATTFRITEDFVVSELFQAESDPTGKGRTANPKKEQTKLMANLLRIHEIPPVISALPLLPEYAARRGSKRSKQLAESGVDFSKLPRFRLFNGMAYALADWGTVGDEARKFGYIEHTKNESAAAWLNNADQRRIVVSVLRKELEGFLWQFEESGLLVDRKKSRAYFAKLDDQGRTIRWNSPLRKNISRGVVKKRSDDVYENEGIAYSIQQYGDQWSIQLKPIYVFTGADGKTPLDWLAQTKLATRRYKFDRNPSVVADFSFWTAFLGAGKSIINISGNEDSPIYVDCALMEVEVMEVAAT